MAQRYLEINGVWEDHVRYAITVEEWAQRRDGSTTSGCDGVTPGADISAGSGPRSRCPTSSHRWR